MSLKDKLKSCFLGYKATEKSYIKHLKKNRYKSGKKCTYISPF